jgi:hypothetical protein
MKLHALDVEVAVPHTMISSISPLSVAVQAVISRQAGRLARSMISEW